MPCTFITVPFFFNHVSKQSLHTYHHNSCKHTPDPISSDFSRNDSQSKDFRNTKNQLPIKLKTSLRNKALESLSNHQPSPQETEVLSLVSFLLLVFALNFGQTSSNLIKPIQKSAALLTQTMNKQFHFRKQT